MSGGVAYTFSFRHAPRLAFRRPQGYELLSVGPVSKPAPPDGNRRYEVDEIVRIVILRNRLHQTQDLEKVVGLERNVTGVHRPERYPTGVQIKP